MFGPRLTTIFASRWRALWWAASILLLTWSLVPAPSEREPHDGFVLDEKHIHALQRRRFGRRDGRPEP